MSDVHKWADQLRVSLPPFQVTDWQYTRDLGNLRSIRYDDLHMGLLGRIRQSFSWLFMRKRDWMGDLSRFSMAWYVLHREPNLPDGVLDGGNIITHWEEAGYYLQFVQPSVGALLADLMDAHPELEGVQAIAEEIARIRHQYDMRQKSEES